jgi:hypothetical protein
VAVVTSDEYPGDALRVFPLEDVCAMADFLETSYVLPQQQRVQMLVNGQEIKLAAFPRDVVANVTRAMVASLKNVPAAKWIEIRLKNPDWQENP